jgi:hypothetical protein
MEKILRVPRVLINHPHDGINLRDLIRMKIGRQAESDPVKPEKHSYNNSEHEPEFTYLVALRSATVIKTPETRT